MGFIVELTREVMTMETTHESLNLNTLQESRALQLYFIKKDILKKKPYPFRIYYNQPTHPVPHNLFNPKAKVVSRTCG